MVDSDDGETQPVGSSSRSELTEGYSAVRAAGQLTLAFAVGWVVCFWPARMLRPEHGIWWMSVGALCNLVPGWVIVLLDRFRFFSTDLKLILGQMGIRISGVMLAVILLSVFRPELEMLDFYVWLIVFYILTIVIEARLLMKNLSRSAYRPTDS